MRRPTLAPLLEWGDLFAAILPTNVQDDELAVAWCRAGEQAFWFSRSSWSLAVIARWRQQLTHKKCVTVWIPDFFCNASLSPLRETGVDLVFYPVTDQMAPDLDFFTDIAGKPIPDLVVLTHYFGQPAATGPIAAFCKEQGAWLIEDAAHVLQPMPGIGEAGDCVLYSPHKHLPIPNGAVLVVRQGGPSQLAVQGQSMSVLRGIRATVLISPGYPSQQAFLWLAKRVLQRLGLRSLPLAAGNRVKVESEAPKISHPRMSSLARRLLIHLKDRLKEVACLREQHTQDWCHTLASVGLEGTIKPLMAKSTPYLAGFFCKQGDGAEILFERLQRAGLPVTTWPDLPPEVAGRVEVHRSAIALRQNLFYLPVHQTLNLREIHACGDRLLTTSTMLWQVSELHRDEWENYWQRCPKATLLQSWQYGAAKEEAEGWKALRYLVADGEGRPIALAQVLTRGLPVIGGIARLNRGPLLLADMPNDDEVQTKLAVLQVLLREARRQRWWIMQVAPELPPTNEVRLGMQMLGLKKMPISAFGSGLLALNVSEQSLLMGLSGKWRNCMRKGEKLGVSVTHHECKGKSLELLLRSYADLQSNRRFEGVSEKLIRALARQHGATWQFSLFVARAIGESPEEEPLGLLVTIKSGDTAIYLIGSASDRGRQMQANSVLLWQAILHAKHIGCCWFDIGGLSEATPKGVAEFKQGVNAIPYGLAGEWRSYLLPRFF